jgi:hypothetical protein
VRTLLCTGPVGRGEARPCAVGQPPYPHRGFADADAEADAAVADADDDRGAVRHFDAAGHPCNHDRG